MARIIESLARTVDREVHHDRQVACDYAVCEPHTYKFIVANSCAIGGSRKVDIACRKIAAGTTVMMMR